MVHYVASSSSSSFFGITLFVIAYVASDTRL